MKVTIFGTGYVGLVTGGCLADIGHDVVCADVNSQKIQSLQSGEIPIYEEGLEEIVLRNQAQGRLSFTTDMSLAVSHRDFQFIAVGTPSVQRDDEQGRADLQYVFAVAETIGKNMNQDTVVVVKSTVPVGTNRKVEEIIQSTLTARGVTVTFDMVSNPEFLREGRAVKDFMFPDRVLIGCQTPEAANQMQSLYQPILKQSRVGRLLKMTVESAELAKYAANGLLSTKISFMNEIALIAEQVGADIESVREAVGTDERIGPHFIQAGCGYGGSCFPKDIRALAQLAKDFNIEPLLLQSVDEVNERQKRHLFSKIKQQYGGNLKNKVVALWGLAFKPGTDDIREASSLTFIDAALNAGMRIQAFDPVAQVHVAACYPDQDQITFCEDLKQSCEGADAIVIVTEWTEFATADLKELKSIMKGSDLFDGRNIFEDLSPLTEAGFVYHGTGRQVFTGS